MFLACARRVEVHVFHRCVIAVIGALAVSTSATAGPISFGENGPSLDIAELRASGVRMGSRELRAIFFRGGDRRSAMGSCAECVSAESSLNAQERKGASNSHYKALFPLSSGNLFKKPASRARTTGRHACPAGGTVARGSAPRRGAAALQPLRLRRLPRLRPRRFRNPPASCSSGRVLRAHGWCAGVAGHSRM